MNHKIKEIHHDLIPLQNGIRLAYRAWMPAGANQQPVPALLEFLPYRKNDGTIVRDEITLTATAKHGYARVRVDIRGTGESEGLFDDEYSEQELSDAEQVIDWISFAPNSKYRALVTPTKRGKRKKLLSADGTDHTPAGVNTGRFIQVKK